MSTIYLDFSVREDSQERIWEASNGKTRTNLVIISKLGITIPANTPFKASIGILEKGFHAFIFLNPEKRDDGRKLGIVTTTRYGLSIKEKEPLFSAYSSGGPGNSCSEMAVIVPRTLVEFPSYKNRSESRFVRFDDNGFHDVSIESIMETDTDQVSL